MMLKLSVVMWNNCNMYEYIQTSNNKQETRGQGWIYLRPHIEHVFNSYAFSLSVPLIDQFVFGPGHVDAIWRGPCSFVVCGVRRCVPVMDQLGLKEKKKTGE